MRLVVLLWLVFSTCQASVLPKGIHKDGANRLEKIVSTLEKTRLWNTLKGWYKNAHEWLWGEDGFITTLYYRAGDPAKSIQKCCRRCCRCRCHHRTSSHPDTSSRWRNDPIYPYTQGYFYGDLSGTSSTDNGAGSSGGICCFGDSNTNGGSVTIPPVGGGPQVTVSSGNGDAGSQANCCGSGDCCSNIDCSGCANCISNIDCSGCADCIGGCCELCCKPEVICCCFYLLGACLGG